MPGARLAAQHFCTKVTNASGSRNCLDEVRKVPRMQQLKRIRTVSALVDQYKRKAG